MNIPIHILSSDPKVSDWDKLRIFHITAQVGSFSKAGRALGRHTTAVSHQIASIEKSLQQSLFHRHPKGLLKTEAGEILHRATKTMYHQISSLERQFCDNKDDASGILRVTAPVTFGSLWLSSRLPKFLQEYPQMQVQIQLSDRTLNISRREADVAIRIGSTKLAGLIEEKLLSSEFCVYASQSYLERFGTPESMDDLDKHKIIAFCSISDYPIHDINWLLTRGLTARKQRRFSIAISNVYGMVRAAEEGGGLVALPEIVAKRSSKLQRVLPSVSGTSLDYFLVYPKELQGLKRLEVFRTFLLGEVKEGL